MQWYEILIIIAAVLFVVGVFVWNLILKKKTGKSLGSDCPGNCPSCCGCGACRKKTNLVEEYHKSEAK